MALIDRRNLLTMLGSVLLPLSSRPARATTPEDGQTVPLADAGFAPDLGERLGKAVRGGELANLHAVVIARHGKLVLERYFEGKDERWGEPLGTVRFAPEVKHDLRSISK